MDDPTVEEIRNRLFKYARGIKKPAATAVSPDMHDSDRSNAAPPKQPAEPFVLKLAETVSTKGAEIESSTRAESAGPLSLQVRQGASSEKGDTARSQLADAVAQMFEEAANFESRLDELHRLFFEVEKVAQAADELFAPLHSFQLRLSRLGVVSADAYVPATTHEHGADVRADESAP